MKHLVIGALALVAAAGCMNDRVYMDPVQNLSGTGTENSLNLRNGTLRGDFGPRTGIDGPAVAEGSSAPGSNSSTVTVTREEEGRGTGMVILWTNNLLLEQLEVGEHSFSYDSSSLDTPSLAANVCSGPDGGSIDYDRPADRGTVVVSNTDEGRQIAVHTETLLDETSGETEVSDTTFVIGAAR
ncbi:MAG: hypothetical protein A2138_20795 [Deltaproteobacteria bacterium RBG_16_71_12]|nr:MAG: hypothetical protein A2138_20795 [Deltaproteobacteria bacterium RBG_16_71_12]